MVKEQTVKSWWQTIPGILSATAAVIAAITGLIVALYQSGIFPSASDSPALAGQHSFRSPDGRYEARKVGSGKDAHYQIREVETKRLVLTTHAEFTTPNNVKAASFSPDSKMFAAAYHYGHTGGYTWIGIWDLGSGSLLRAETPSGWITDISSVFKKQSPAELQR
ncbi:MAG: hypothetical protein MN733_00685 [Nitrososphaera sp.]|nr:hypothetical protein [Nitrososphaera sp.]